MCSHFRSSSWTCLLITVKIRDKYISYYTILKSNNNYTILWFKHDNPSGMVCCQEWVSAICALKSFHKCWILWLPWGQLVWIPCNIICLETLLDQQPNPSRRMGYHPNKNYSPTWGYSCRCRWSQEQRRRNLCINMTHYSPSRYNSMLLRHWKYTVSTKVQNRDLFIDYQEGGLFPSNWGNL